jgi:hypothetical protein
MVYHLALQLLGNHDDGLDLSQDVWRPVGVSLPHVAADTRTAAILMQPFPPLELKHLALSAVARWRRTSGSCRRAPVGARWR